MNEDWSYITVNNPPYSLAAQFIAKAALEYR
jgi:hypothetical protein